jgi:hypothetical protein
VALGTAGFGAGAFAAAGRGAGGDTLASGAVAAIGPAWAGFGSVVLGADFFVLSRTVTGFFAGAFLGFFDPAFFDAAFVLTVPLPPRAPALTFLVFLAGAALLRFLAVLRFDFDFFAMAHAQELGFGMPVKDMDGRDGPGHEHSQST